MTNRGHLVLLDAGDVDAGAVGGVEQTGNSPHSLLGFDKLTQRLRSVLRLGSTSHRDLAQRLRRHGAPLVPRERDEGYRRAERR